MGHGRVERRRDSERVNGTKFSSDGVRGREKLRHGETTGALGTNTHQPSSENAESFWSLPPPSSSTMSRSMRQRLPLYHSLHRPSSHPLSTLAVSPPSTSRPVLSSPPRLPSEAPKQSPHSQLALTQPSPQAPLFPYTPPILAPALAPAAGPSSAAVPHPTPETPRAHKRARLQYQLDVGAYGIPKSRPTPSNPHHSHHRSFHTRPTPPVPHTHRSVQVGEDAYFVTHNAMGIADGVGGWARVAPHTSHHQQHPTPSALFSRRLMHFCAAELEVFDAAPLAASASTAVGAGAGVRPPTTTHFSFEHHLKPRPAPPPPPIRSESYAYPFAELEDSLDDLADGIDVLQILERAYDSTVRAHIAPSASTPSSAPTPLTTGSSTALLAVLDHPPSGPLKQSPEAPHRNYAAGSLLLPAASQSGVAPEETALPADQVHVEAHATEMEGFAYDAVVHIAHLGDCMGMLVRGDEIVWRSDEMWWGYNHPLQLGPPPSGTYVNITAPSPAAKSTTATTGSPTARVLSTAQSAAAAAAAAISNTTTTPTPTPALIPLPVQPHTFTLPVRADDILILASDGLGDNLWDEDVLDEVLRVRDAAGLAASGPVPVPVREPAAEVAGTAGMAEGLRRAFVGLEVRAAAAYPSPPVSASPSPPPPPEGADAPSSSSSPAPSCSAAPRRRAFAGTLAEALCSRANCVSERRGAGVRGASASAAAAAAGCGAHQGTEGGDVPVAPGEVPFGRRAALAGRVFRGGKCDDISVIVAVISPSPLHEPSISSSVVVAERVSSLDGGGVGGASTSTLDTGRAEMAL